MEPRICSLLEKKTKIMENAKWQHCLAYRMHWPVYIHTHRIEIQFRMCEKATKRTEEWAKLPWEKADKMLEGAAIQRRINDVDGENSRLSGSR